MYNFGFIKNGHQKWLPLLQRIFDENKNIGIKTKLKNVLLQFYFGVLLRQLFSINQLLRLDIQICSLEMYSIAGIEIHFLISQYIKLPG